MLHTVHHCWTPVQFHPQINCFYMEFLESNACLSVCAEISPFLCTADMPDQKHGWPRISTRGCSTISDADGTMTSFRNKSNFNLGNSFKILDMLISVRKRCSGQQTHFLRLHQKTPHTEWGANGPSSGGDQWPPRQWDELVTDTGTAAGSWHDCLCPFIL